MTLLEAPLPPRWRATTIGADADVLTGFPFPSQGYSQSGPRLVRGSNVKRGVLDWADAVTKRWPEVTGKLARYQLAVDDVIVAMDGALVGRSYAVISERDLPALLLQRVARLRSSSIDHGLLLCWIGSPWFARHVDANKTHTAIPHISPADIRGFHVRVPEDPAEQRAIAEALEDVGRLIVALERLIRKKRDIKLGSMQKLLTGQTRLAGFQRPWRPKSLGELLSYEHPNRYLVSTADYAPAGGVPVLTAGKTFILGHTLETDGIYDAGSVVIFDDFTTSSRYVDFPFKAKSSAMKMLTARLGVADLRFVGERMQLINFPIADHKRRWISEYQYLAVSTPEIDEQEAIASVLSDMDAEIVAFEDELAKMKDIKRGMLQALLSGRARLVGRKVAA
jgi:type I restriction enzyme S subunit